MAQRITIVDYGMGNLHSVRRRFERIGVNTIVASDANDLRRAERVVLPGIGHFQRAMENLRALHLLEALDEVARARRVPVLGICLGMQLMARRSEEGGDQGLGWVDAEVVRFRVDDPVRYKVPHIGWNGITVRKDSALLKGVPSDGQFYFAHSYHLVTSAASIVLCETAYSHPFASAIESENLFGVQFHPEKSHGVGELVLRNFVRL
jgi:glutamine amidotransferase